TGYLVGATPRLQQYAILIGALTSALVIGGALILFYSAGTGYSNKPEDLPQGTLSKEQGRALTEAATDKGQTVHVLRPPEGEFAIKAGKYLVDDSGVVRYLVDPSIMGQLTKTEDGKEVTRFDAPKTQVMGLIINGVLKRDLNWTMVIIGAMIAITLELCGISSLAFAVGVYVDIKYSVPIFIGGLARLAMDYFTSRRAAAAAVEGDAEARARAEVAAIAQAESSPAVLLASGYIAGGSLAGVLVAFLEFL